MTTAETRAVVNTCKGKMDTDLKKSRWVWRPKGNYLISAPKTESRNKVLVTETYVWDEEEVSSDDEQMVQAKVLMALAEVEQLVGKNLTRNGSELQIANLLEDIQCAGSDTRPPMLDRTDFASWQQRIRLYCRGKENGVNILKSIDEGPFQMGTFWETLTERTEGAPHLGPERPRVYSDLSPEDKDRYNADIRATNILL
ncbi:hypothetical protein Tco_1484805 [Tanacetum coccineum]